MADVAPSAEFQFIAHLPEWGLGFPITDDNWGGAIPTVQPESGSTVWGAVYSIPDQDFEQLNTVEESEHRIARTVEAMDRNGRRHQVVVHLTDSNNSGNAGESPSVRYLSLMLDGSRHWSLPAGWIAGLEEHLENGS